MGCDIYSFAEVKSGGKWLKVGKDVFANNVFSSRSYSLFGFLANVRNVAKCPSFAIKGLPIDSEYLNEKINCGFGMSYTRLCEIIEMGYHSMSYLTLDELVDFDYSMRFSYQGKDIAVKEFLSDTELFSVIETLKQFGDANNVRIVFYFSS